MGILFICRPSSIICARAEQGCKMMLQGPQINNMPDKSHVIIYYHQYTRPNNTIFQHITKESTIMYANVFVARLLASFVEGSLIFGPVY